MLALLWLFRVVSRLLFLASLGQLSSLLLHLLSPLFLLNLLPLLTSLVIK